VAPVQYQPVEGHFSCLKPMRYRTCSIWEPSSLSLVVVLTMRCPQSSPKPTHKRNCMHLLLPVGSSRAIDKRRVVPTHVPLADWSMTICDLWTPCHVHSVPNASGRDTWLIKLIKSWKTRHTSCWNDSQLMKVIVQCTITLISTLSMHEISFVHRTVLSARTYCQMHA